jgi:hypothetical protein
MNDQIGPVVRDTVTLVHGTKAVVANGAEAEAELNTSSSSNITLCGRTLYRAVSHPQPGIFRKGAPGRALITTFVVMRMPALFVARQDLLLHVVGQHASIKISIESGCWALRCENQQQRQK